MFDVRGAVYVSTLIVLLSIVSGQSKKSINNVLKGKYNVIDVVNVALHALMGTLVLKALISKNVATFKNNKKDNRSIAEKLYSHDPLV